MERDRVCGWVWFLVTSYWVYSFYIGILVLREGMVVPRIVELVFVVPSFWVGEWIFDGLCRVWGRDYGFVLGDGFPVFVYLFFVFAVVCGYCVGGLFRLVYCYAVHKNEK